MLNRLALRLSTVRALRGRTFAGANVLDSEIPPIEDVVESQAKPFILVYTDNGHFRGAGRDLYAVGGDHRHDVGYQHLLIEIALSQRMTIEDETTGQPTQAIGQPPTDAALELYLDLMERQVVDALMDPRPEALWADVWRTIVQKIGDRESVRGASQRDGVRFAGRQMKISLELPKDPPPGEPLGPLWTRFLALAATDTSLAPMLPLLTAALAAPGGLADWQVIAAEFGLSRGEAADMLIAPGFPLGSAP